jgi:hypothetical protein
MSYRFVNIKNLLMSFIAAISFSGCFQNYYKASAVTGDSNSQKAVSIDNFNKQHRYFILRNGKDAWYMKDVSLGQDNKSLQAELGALPDDHKMYLKKDRDSVMRYKQNKAQDQKVFSEVHVFIVPDSTIIGGNYTLQLTDIKKIELIEKNKGKTIGSYLLGAGLLITFFAGFFAVMLANMF